MSDKQTGRATLTLPDFSSLHGIPWHASTETVCERARALGWALCSYSDPTADGRDGLTVEDAVLIASEDGGLIYLSRPVAIR